LLRTSSALWCLLLLLLVWLTSSGAASLNRQGGSGLLFQTLCKASPGYLVQRVGSRRSVHREQRGASCVGAMPRGAFIVFEGLDRSGKSSQSQRLAASLKDKGHDVKAIRFPNREGPLGQLIDAFLRKDIDFTKRTCHHLFSSDRWEKQCEIQAAVLSGTTVISDRYAFSGVAYSSGAEGLPLEWCKNADSGLIAPDTVFYIDVSPEEANRRKGYGAERYEKLEIQRRVYSSYMHFSTQPYWHAIDGTKDIDSIAAEVCVKAEQVVSSVAASDAPVTTLWDNAPLQQSAKVAESTAVEGASSSSVTSRLQ